MRSGKQYRNHIVLPPILAPTVGFGLISALPLPFWSGRFVTDLQRVMDRPYFRVGQFPITFVFLLKAAIYLLLLLVASRYARRIMQKRVLPLTSMGLGQQYALARVIAYSVFLLGLMVGLQSSGVNLNTFLVLGGTLGIGLGFGLQNIANNFVSGLILLAEQPIRVGDRVEVGGTSGDVTRIGGRSTWVRTNDNVVIIVPNSEFVSDRVTNWTLHDTARFALSITVAPNSDPEKVRMTLLDVAHENADVLATPAPDVLCNGIGGNGLSFELRVWSAKQLHTPSVLRSDLYFQILRAFRDHGIELPLST